MLAPSTSEVSSVVFKFSGAHCACSGHAGQLTQAVWTGWIAHAESVPLSQVGYSAMALMVFVAEQFVAVRIAASCMSLPVCVS